MGPWYKSKWSMESCCFCKKCNRGNEGKFDMPADKIFYDKPRNLYFFEMPFFNSVLLSLNLNPSN